MKTRLRPRRSPSAPPSSRNDGERDEVRVERPLQPGDIRVQITRDRRQRDVDDGAVEERDARAEHRRGEDPPAGGGAESDHAAGKYYPIPSRYLFSARTSKRPRGRRRGADGRDPAERESGARPVLLRRPSRRSVRRPACCRGRRSRRAPSPGRACRDGGELQRRVRGRDERERHEPHDELSARNSRPSVGAAPRREQRHHP